MRLLRDPAFLSATIGAIHDCALDPTRWSTVMGDLAALLGASPPGRRGAARRASRR
jgi:hypothetical protein